MKFEIIADIHANREAFQVVLEDAKDQGFTLAATKRKIGEAGLGS